MLWLVAREFHVVARVLLLDFKHRRSSTLVWQGYCNSPIPWWRKHAYKIRSREKSLTIHWSRQKYIRFTSQRQTTAWGEQYMRSAILAAQRKGMLKYCQCPVVTSWINYFLFVEFHFVLGTGFSVVWDACFKNSAFSGIISHYWSVWPDAVCWIAEMELLSTTHLLNS